MLAAVHDAREVAAQMTVLVGSYLIAFAVILFLTAFVDHRPTKGGYLTPGLVVFRMSLIAAMVAGAAHTLGWWQG